MHRGARSGTAAGAARSERMIQHVHHIVGEVSTRVANFAGHPVVQVSALAGCALWLALGWSEAALASALTIGGFVLTQMVLNQQRRRENALHLKIDELIIAMKGARNEVAGIDQAAEMEIERLREGHQTVLRGRGRRAHADLPPRRDRRPLGRDRRLSDPGDGELTWRRKRAARSC